MACIKETETSKQKSKSVFPFVRNFDQGQIRFYYPFGNSPAEDFLHHNVKTADPKVLVLGCGDLRSCFYTIWKHFNPSAPTSSKRFKSVSFTLNDYIAAIIARNVVFLALCIQLPQEDAEKKKHLCAMWAIWYCHELYPNHNKLLNSALETVVNFSSSLEQWSSQSNPLHKIVQFTSSTTLDEVAKVWKMWLYRKVRVKSKSSMLIERGLWRKSKGFLNEELMLRMLHVFPVTITKTEYDVLEISGYTATGNCYAEEVLDIPLPRNANTEINLTMFEREDGKYTAHYNLYPFEGYFHSHQFTDEFFDRIIEFAKPKLLVSSEKFLSKPFLANSFQQFTMWIESTSHILKRKKNLISFNFCHQDAVAFCLHQMQKNKASLDKDLPGKMPSFDIISTSNLIDHLGLPNMLLSCVPLLRAEGLLITSSFKIRFFHMTGSEYLDMSFGLGCQLHSVLLGVRCLGYEGKFSSPIFMKPSPPDPSNVSPMKLNNITRIFLWRKLPQVQKVIISQMPVTERGNITEGLVKLFNVCSSSLLHCGQIVCTSNTTETAIAFMEWFISGLDGGVSDHSYWEPLGAALKESIPAFLYCIQTQMLLHGIHVHLTFDETDCPICQQKKLSEALGYFSAIVTVSGYGSSTYFLAYLHRLKSLKEPNELHIQAQEGKDVYIFDCFHITACEENTKLQLNFFAPLSLLNKGYCVSIYTVQKSPMFLNVGRVEFTVSLESLRNTWTEYKFYPLAFELRQETSVDLSLGRVTSHQVYNGCKSETKLKLSEDALSLPTSQLKTKRVSSSRVQINWGTLSFQLNSAFPIDYNEVKVSLSKKSSVLTLSCTHQIHDFEEDQPCFIASPGNQLSLVPINLDPDFLSRHAEMQLTEQELSFISNSSVEKMTPLLSAKLFLKEVFVDTMTKKVMAYEIHTDSPKCLIVVNSLLFDSNLRTLAVDLAYCFLDGCKESSLLYTQWELFTDRNKKVLTPECWRVMKKLLTYFGKRTHGTVQGRGQFKVLNDSMLGSFFTRAVFYYVSINPDERKVWSIGYEMPELSTSKPKCAYCYNSANSLFKCSKCQVISYCSQRCEFLHQFLHERLCDHITKNSYNVHTHYPHSKRDDDQPETFSFEEMFRLMSESLKF